MNPSKKYLCGIIGFPIRHTASPAMHQAAFNFLHLDGNYCAFEVLPENLKKAIEGFRALAMTGLNVTLPHKERVVRFLDELSPQARLIQAVNTIHYNAGRLIGHNTDADGFGLALEESWRRSMKGGRFAVVGAGGAARSVIVKLAMSGAASLICMNRTPQRLFSLVRLVKKNFPAVEITATGLYEKRKVVTGLKDIDCIVNATSLGMDPNDPLPLDVALLNSRTFVYDLVYRPFESAWVAAAKRRGLSSAGGFLMLLYQGAKSFQIWTGYEPPLAVMKKTLIHFLRARP